MIFKGLLSLAGLAVAVYLTGSLVWGVVALGVLGVGSFNLFLYLGLQRTTATNAMLLTASAAATRAGRSAP